MIEQDDKALEKRRKNQREVNAFHRSFDSEDGRLVLELLRKKFQTQSPAFPKPAAGCLFDTHAAAIRDGQREVIVYIETVLQIPVTGDANFIQAPEPIKSE